MKRTAQATWRGALATGEGRLSTESGSLAEARYSLPTRFGNEVGTNAEELIAAAHASCFSMALAFILGSRRTPPDEIRTAAELSFERDGPGWSVTGVHLSVVARVPGLTSEDFREAAQLAKATCLVSRLLNTNITMDASLEAAAETC
jgi:lipoyl-dependent peroxiredoxin